MNPTDRRSFMQAAAGAMAAMAILPDLDLHASTAARRGDPVAIGVVGVGRQGRAIIGELQKIDGASVAAICDTDEARLRSGRRRVPNAPAFADYRRMLDEQSDLSAVIVATPTHLHKQVALDALDAGKHVYCEAPIASTVEDCRALADAARRAATVFQAGLQGRSDPIYQLARTFVSSGAIRDIAAVRAQYHRKTSWRTPASDPQRRKALDWKLDPAVSIGLAGEFGTQQFDVVHWYTRRYPVAVRGSGAVRLYDDGREIADTIGCELEFDNGLRLQYDATLANSFEGTYELFMGEMGAIKLAWTAGWLFKEADAPTQGWEVYANRQQFHREEGITLIADATQLAAQGKLKAGVGLPNSPLHYALLDFVKSVSEGAPVACGAQEGMRATIVGILANEAIVTGERVAIDRDLFKEG